MSMRALEGCSRVSIDFTVPEGPNAHLGVDPKMFHSVKAIFKE